MLCILAQINHPFRLKVATGCCLARADFLVAISSALCHALLLAESGGRDVIISSEGAAVPRHWRNNSETSISLYKASIMI